MKHEELLKLAAEWMDAEPEDSPAGDALDSLIDAGAAPQDLRTVLASFAEQVASQRVRERELKLASDLRWAIAPTTTFVGACEAIHELADRLEDGKEQG